MTLLKAESARFDLHRPCALLCPKVEMGLGIEEVEIFGVHGDLCDIPVANTRPWVEPADRVRLANALHDHGSIGISGVDDLCVDREMDNDL